AQDRGGPGCRRVRRPGARRLCASLGSGAAWRRRMAAPGDRREIGPEAGATVLERAFLAEDCRLNSRFRRANEMQELPDVDIAIVGGGIGGIYAGWRLVTSPRGAGLAANWANAPGSLKVALLQGRDRIRRPPPPPPPPPLA